MGDSIKVVDDNYIRRIHSSNTSGKLHKGVSRQESFNADPKTFSFNLDLDLDLSRVRAW